MALKDALRERDIADITRTLGRLVLQFHSSSPPLAVLALDSIRRYTNWVDIALVANPDFVAVLFAILSGASRTVLPFSKLNKMFFGYFDLENIFIDN